MREETMIPQAQMSNVREEKRGPLANRTECSHRIEKYIAAGEGTRTREEMTGRVLLYTLEPGDHTRYTIMLAPLNSAMGDALGLGPEGSAYHMVTLIRGDTMRSYPVDLSNVWQPGYLKEKFGITDQYTQSALYILLSFIGDELRTEALFIK